MTLQTYLPQDRLRALARGESLPDRASGSALFADISGFTPLTETMRESLGPRRGAEELTKHLNAVYTALITEVERYGGSVVDFAGDAIICWFDDSNGPAAQHSAACAFALQDVMRIFVAINLPNNKAVTLSLKVAVASGSARRFVVGDPNVQRLDVLAGATIARTSLAEHLAQKGEVLVDEATVHALDSSLTVSEWRNDGDERFAVAGKFVQTIQPVSQSSIPILNTEQLQTWIHHAVYDREVSNQSAFLTEFRPCVALFVRFIAIDYDADNAETQLDAFIQRAQTIAARYDGILMDITIGDKGSYAYINLGALSAHEDDARRAVKIALELHNGSDLQIQTGIAQGTMRVGAYGGETRRVYGALGDDVNLAARLMQTAAPGEILLSRDVYKATANDFVFEPRPPLPMKGKAEPLPVFTVTSERQQRAIRLQEPQYALPMVGREAELQTINDKLALALQGKPQIIAIVAEAGMGKSRLVAEAIRLARRKGFTGYGGACQSDAINTPYQAWKAIWSAYFDVDPSAPLRKQIRLLEGEIDDRTPERVPALPLLGQLLDIAIPDNDFTQSLEPKDRKGALHALLEDCLKTAAKDEPLLIVIEDLHWIDVLSHDLLEELARSLTESPLCFVLAYRPPQLQRLQVPRLEALPNFTKIELHELNAAECEQAIRAKLAQLYPARGGAVPSALVEKLMARAQGNPFYLEELLNFLRDRGLDPREPAALEKIELPDSLHTLVLSRIDQLTDHEKITLRVASIVGRLFRASWLTGYYPALGDLPQVKSDLNNLRVLDITPLDSPEPELAHLFKHIVTHEVTYESMPFATRAKLHELLAQYLESIYFEDPPLDAITYHYSQSENLPKKREYFRKSAEAAFAVYSNETALEYYKQALALLPVQDELIDLHLKSGAILEVIGKRADAAVHYKAALQTAEENNFTERIIECQIKVGNTWGDYSQSLEWMNKALKLARQTDDSKGICDALNEISNINWRLGDFDTAEKCSQESLELARHKNDKRREAAALFFLASIHAERGDYAGSHAFFEATLTIRRKLNEPRLVGATLLNWGTTYYYQGDYQTAQKYIEESLVFYREIGDKRHTTIALNNLGNIFYLRNDYHTARDYYTEALALGRELADKYTTSLALASLGITAFQEGNLEEADNCYREGMVLSRALNHKVTISLFHCYLGLLALARGQINTARNSFREGLKIAHQSNMKAYIIYNLIGCACVYLAESKPSRAVILLRSSSANAEAMGLKLETELQRPYDQALDSAKKGMDEETFSAAWDKGQRITMEEAVQLALGNEKG